MLFNYGPDGSNMLQALEVALAAKQAEADKVRRSRLAAVEARERRVQDQIDTAMLHNEEVNMIECGRGCSHSQTGSHLHRLRMHTSILSAA